jgi:hypothetical protein
MSILARLLRRGPQTRWWLISRHRALGVDAFVWGPFRTEQDAHDYPGTFFGFVDATAMRPETYDLRVEAAPACVRPTLIAQDTHDSRMRGRDDVA